jgi:hypothetical protein
VKEDRVEQNQQRPRRRGTTHVETLHGELCVYEWTTKTVHALNPAAARVWELCDGRTSVEEMVAAVGGEARGAAAIVQHALREFARAGLLERDTAAGLPELSRRALLRRIGTAAAIPIVTSIAAPAPLAAQSGSTQTFNATGAPQSFMVPAGVTSLHVDAVGASGAGVTGVPTPPGPPGGRVQALLPVTPGETLTIMVGSPGTNNIGGFNGGGLAGGIGYGGGGASDVRRGSTVLIVAGGGGGYPGSGGAGGGLIGAAGTGGCGPGGGGTQSAGGPGGSGSDIAGMPGAAGTGGAGAPPVSPSFFGGSGGGGGYFGGGGGGACAGNSAGSGGGGSSYTDPTATGVVHTQGFGGSPRIILSW